MQKDELERFSLKNKEERLFLHIERNLLQVDRRDSYTSLFILKSNTPIGYISNESRNIIQIFLVFDSTIVD